MDYRKDITEYIELEREVLSKLDVDALNEAMQLIEEAYRNRKKVYIFGNGGSSATASHYQNDFNKGVSEHIEIPFRFQCLNDNVATLMAIANDISYDEVFRFQLSGRLKPEDLVIGISGSGNSVNVIRAAEYAKEVGAGVVGISGFTGGRLWELSDFHMHVPIEDMQMTEDLHITFDHMMYRVISNYLKTGV